jgi:hypothetical protein
VSVLLPVRNEAYRLEPGLHALLRAIDYCGNGAELIVLDDESTDDTASVVRRVLQDATGATLHQGSPRPAGWLGKPWACEQLARLVHPSSTVLVFVDADVVVAPQAIAACVAQLRKTQLDLVSPYPRQLAVTLAERIVQPLLQWSWLTTLPLRLAERSPRPSLGAANGQLLAVDAATYRRAGGHAAVRDEVLDDLALLRAVKRVGGAGGVTDGTHLATCRMYDGWDDLYAGYTKSLWSAFGSGPGLPQLSEGCCSCTSYRPLLRSAGRRSGRLATRLASRDGCWWRAERAAGSGRTHSAIRRPYWYWPGSLPRAFEDAGAEH